MLLVPVHSVLFDGNLEEHRVLAKHGPLNLYAPVGRGNLNTVDINVRPD